MAIFWECVSTSIALRKVQGELFNYADIAMAAPLVAVLTPDLSDLG